MATFLIGIDDTDNETSPGTGPLARRLAEEIRLRGAKLLGITRHQLLVDDQIPYTAQNRGACIAFDWTGSLGELEFVGNLIAQWAADGSDPGMCIAVADEVPRDIMEWGWQATREVLTQSQAIALARTHGLFLRSLGGSGDGIIGALASVGLRADGNEGWFHDLPGLRMLGDVVQIKELTDIGIRVEHRLPNGTNDSDAMKLGHDAAPYKASNWVSPRLVGGQPVWPVEWSEHEHAWIPVYRKKSRPLE